MKKILTPTDLVLRKIRENRRGIHITRIVEELAISRSTVRIALAFLLGAEKIKEGSIGMSKLYTIK